MSKVLEVTDLQKSFTLHEFNGKRILGCESVSFSVHPGEFVGITGKSGSGKSTMLKCLYRTYLPTSGEIWFASELFGRINLASTTERQISTIRRREIGYVSQFLNVLPRVTAQDVVANSLVETGIDEETSHQRAASILSHFQISKNLWDAYPQNFSGGEKLRLNLAKEMVKQPRLLLLDEPTASLDNASKELVKEILNELKQSGTSMVGIFHDLDFMEQTVDTHYKMNQGVLGGVTV
ncbi:phosphonate C-P lyase system protein PhnL [Alicyclobacillus fastidiosus]|uniref:Phosphonate C-P lyase system protein PhnL n=1 Tax=Alicyclobacillus fastidiosus TaxID=392011 RepID=A0ABY6ZMR8_9BACL|nr:phosphonate C-P lyase system protein PhnL [Alicyclobacillus fastidiosus]WAH44139.1 phosphonate C-P lyase system protein PhnL [Alicyclobacillus fastidiosus]GMA60441.1 ABC transporter [Alicyclobacillus fastidiosus]